MKNLRIKRPITLARRVVQFFLFSLIIFGATLWGIKKQNLSFLPFVEPKKEHLEYKQQLKKTGKIIPVVGPGYPQAFDTYLPIKSCRFSRTTGTFRACFMHFVSECISWVTPLRIVLPHILLFVIFAILFGRLWCGWVCPLGFISDVLNIIRKNLKLNPLFLPERLNRQLKFTSYALFIAILILSILSALTFFPWDIRKQIYLSICQMCPSRFIFPYISNWPIVHSFLPIGYGIFTAISIIFLLFFLLSFFIKRTWCRICPSGLLLSFFNRGSFLTKEKDVSKCTRCGICLNLCPLQNENIYLEKVKANVDYPGCIHCFSCVDYCPEDRCLKVKFFGLKIFNSKFR